MNSEENSGPYVPEEIINEINEAASPVERELSLRNLCARAWSFNVSTEEASLAKEVLKNLGYDPDYIDELNNRRDLDNPLSVSQCYDQLILAKQRKSESNE